jgi:hypothetical protein
MTKKKEYEPHASTYIDTNTRMSSWRVKGEKKQQRWVGHKKLTTLFFVAVHNADKQSPLGWRSEGALSPERQ